MSCSLTLISRRSGIESGTQNVLFEEAFELRISNLEPRIERWLGLMRFSTIEEAVEEIRQGRMLVVVDDEDRENEGDLVMAAELATPEAINFMIIHGRGLVCMPITGERLDLLELPDISDQCLLLHAIHCEHSHQLQLTCRQLQCFQQNCMCHLPLRGFRLSHGIR